MGFIIRFSNNWLRGTQMDHKSHGQNSGSWTKFEKSQDSVPRLQLAALGHTLWSYTRKYTNFDIHGRGQKSSVLWGKITKHTHKHTCACTYTHTHIHTHTHAHAQHAHCRKRRGAPPQHLAWRMTQIISSFTKSGTQLTNSVVKSTNFILCTSPIAASGFANDTNHLKFHPRTP